MFQAIVFLAALMFTMTGLLLFGTGQSSVYSLGERDRKVLGAIFCLFGVAIMILGIVFLA